MGKRKFRTTVFLEEGQVEGLRKLSHSTRILMSTYIREGIDLVLAKYNGGFRKTPKGERSEMTG